MTGELYSGVIGSKETEGQMTHFSMWGLCGENCPKSAKVWKISKNMEFKIHMISICYPNLRRLGNSRFLTSNP